MFVTFVTGLIFFGAVTGNKGEKFIEALITLCEETSNKHPLMTFHFKLMMDIHLTTGTNHLPTTTPYYIEVFISETTANAIAVAPYYNDPEIVIAPAPLFMSASAYEPVTVMKRYEASHSGAERLQELENMKHLLTEKEYGQKRDDIIAAV